MRLALPQFEAPPPSVLTCLVHKLLYYLTCSNYLGILVTKKSLQIGGRGGNVVPLDNTNKYDGAERMNMVGTNTNQESFIHIKPSSMLAIWCVLSWGPLS